jgi:hypothetical protein
MPACLGAELDRQSAAGQVRFHESLDRAVALRADPRIGHQPAAEAQELERRCLAGTATADQAVQPVG